MIKTTPTTAYLCTDEQYMTSVYKNCGRPGVRVLQNKIHWVPFKVKWEGQPII